MALTGAHEPIVPGPAVKALPRSVAAFYDIVKGGSVNTFHPDKVFAAKGAGGPALPFFLAGFFLPHVDHHPQLGVAEINQIIPFSTDEKVPVTDPFEGVVPALAPEFIQAQITGKYIVTFIPLQNIVKDGTGKVFNGDQGVRVTLPAPFLGIFFVHLRPITRVHGRGRPRAQAGRDALFCLDIIRGVTALSSVQEVPVPPAQKDIVATPAQEFIPSGEPVQDIVPPTAIKRIPGRGAPDALHMS